MAEQYKEQRKYVRIPFREDILLDGTRRCTSMDICEGGLYISAIQIFEKDSIIDVTIPFKEGRLTVKAQVQYCQPGIGMGIQFLEMDDRQTAIIKKLIEGLKIS
jgi:hypothetical protein